MSSDVPEDCWSEDLDELQRQLAQIDLLTEPRRRSRKGDDYSELLLAKRQQLKFKMYQEPGHKLPHIHVDYGRQHHAASFQIHPPRLLSGNLGKSHCASVVSWIAPRTGSLLDLWARLQSGATVARFMRELAGDA